ncbi:hypothetical protein N824_22390 [Pedobacter sp. V48]|nr:hypothetical protein N824_22390 [Pedobacter sp. V48]
MGRLLKGTRINYSVQLAWLFLLIGAYQMPFHIPWLTQVTPVAVNPNQTIPKAMQGEMTMK